MLNTTSGLRDNPLGLAEAVGAVALRLLGGFAFELAGQVAADTAWRQRQTRQLLTLLASAQHSSETRAMLQRELWPGFETERARNRLHHTVHLVRKAWQTLPGAIRPRLKVTSERIALEMPVGALVDITEFKRWLESDATDPDERLQCLRHALQWYRGPLAPDWIDGAAISSRRQRLVAQHIAALEEAAQLCFELGRVSEGLSLARLRALSYTDDVKAQCDYANALAEHGEVDAALRHCTQCREGVDSPQARASFDELLRTIQRRSNQARDLAMQPETGAGQVRAPANEGKAGTAAASDGAAHAAPHTPTELSLAGSSAGALSARPSPPVGSSPPATAAAAHALRDDTARAHFEAPFSLRPLGCKALLELAEMALQDPFLSIVSLVGPPGAGKTSIAIELGRRFGERMRHGAMWVAPESPGQLREALVQACTLHFGPQGGSWQTIARALAGKELLIVLDASCGLGENAEELRRLAQAGPELRVLLAARQPLGLDAEKVLLVEPAQMEQTSDPRQASPAARICLGAAPRLAAHDAGLSHFDVLESVEAIAAALGGLPALLTVAGHGLQRQSPGEFLDVLQKRPTETLQAAALAGGSHALNLLERHRQWLADMADNARQQLVLMASCRSWLTRVDLHVLLDDGTGVQTEAFIEYALARHYIRRRLRGQRFHSWSEFQVPTYVALALRDDAHREAELPWMMARRAVWLLTGPPREPTALPTAGMDIAKWIDERLEDFDSLMRTWLQTGREADVIHLCLAHATTWPMIRSPEVVEGWLGALSMRGLAWPDLGRLLLLRARLRIRLGHFQAAVEDASRCAKAVSDGVDANADENAPCGDSPSELRQHALRIIDRYGARSSKAPRPVWLTARGVDAGESLMRAAHIAASRGDWNKALRACDQALNVFNYFGLVRSQITAHQYRAHIAYCAGDAALAEQCALAAERSARALGDLAEAARGLALQGFAACARLQFERGSALATEVLSLPETLTGGGLHARAMLLLSWTHFGQGALPAARALADALRSRYAALAEPWVRMDSEALACLIDARQGRRGDAMRGLQRLAEEIDRRKPILDMQGALIYLAELLSLCGQPQMCAEALRALHGVTTATGAHLRPWTDVRAKVLRAEVEPGRDASSRTEPEVTLAAARLKTAALIDALLRREGRGPG